MNRLAHILLLAGCWLAACLAVVPQVCAAPDDAQVQTTVREVLDDPEFRHLHREVAAPEPDKTSETPEWLKTFFKWLFGPERRERAAYDGPKLDLSQFLFYTVLVVLVVVLLILLFALLKRLPASSGVDAQQRAADQEAITPSTPPGDLPTNEYERRAVLAAQTGDYRSAIRELVLGCMSWTERSGMIRYRRGLTNRDYIRAVWRQLPHRESLLTISGAFERVFYGRRTADVTMYETCLSEFRQTFAQEPAHAPLAG